MIPPRLVDPATETLHVNPVVVVPLILGLLVEEFQSPCMFNPPVTAESTYDLTADCVGYNTSDVPNEALFDLLEESSNPVKLLVNATVPDASGNSIE